ncbi:hypothetical protein AAAX09_02495 [Bifidobacterium longum]
MSNIIPLRAGVVGCGAISDAYLTNLAKRFRIVQAVACRHRDTSSIMI